MRSSQLIKIAAKSGFALLDPLFGPLPGPRILIYHQVGVDFGREMEVSTSAFRGQLNWIESRGEITDLETAVERRNERNADQLFVLTFDDGFDDVYHNAFPLMQQRGIPFTLYLTTHPIETGEPLDPNYPGARPLTWKHVNEMIGSGLVTVGAHTHSHPDLRNSSPNVIAQELALSDGLIEERTGIRPRHFTYPWGWWSQAADRQVRQRYDTATVGSGWSGSGSDIHQIERLPIQASDSRFLFPRKALTGSPMEARARALIRKSSA